MGTAGLLLLRGSEPVMATVMMQGVVMGRGFLNSGSLPATMGLLQLSGRHRGCKTPEKQAGTGGNPTRPFASGWSGATIHSFRLRGGPFPYLIALRKDGAWGHLSTK
jgi:hypothetical protein